jgi:SAM-dependent methyltransferase
MRRAVLRNALNAVHDKAIFGRRVEVLSRHLAEMIPAGPGRMLDLGAGDGSIALRVAAQHPGLEVEGVDVLLRPVRHIPVTEYDGTTLPFENDSFDWVTIVDVLHHTDDPAVVLAEAARVAKRGVLVKDHLREGMLAGPTLRAMDWVGNRGHGVRLPYNYLTETEWSRVLDRCGLVARERRTVLGLYPIPLDPVFGRRLHFIARYAKKR